MSEQDPWAGLQTKLSTDLMHAFLRMPASLKAMMEGEEGPVDIPPEQAAEAYVAVLMVVLKHLPTIAGAVDIARGEISRLVERVDAIERRLEENWAGDGQ